MVRRRPVRADSAPRSLQPRTARLAVALLLVLHAALAVGAMARNSVTFDENFHLPAGLMILERADYYGSVAQPPLPKMLYALPAVLLGARLPEEHAIASGDEGTVGESFMRRNWSRYAEIYFASRLIALLFSLALAIVVWRWTRMLYGEAGGVLGVALYALSPEALAHAGIVGTDLPTALAFTLALFTFWRFLAAPSRRTWLWLAGAWAAAFLTRFSAIQLIPVGIAATAMAQARGRLARPRTTWLALAALLPVAWLAICAGYLFQIYPHAWGSLPFRSGPFLSFSHRFPWLVVPLPTAFLSGLDYMLMLNEQGSTYLLGHVHPGVVWYYFPLALLFKLPLGTWGALLLRAFARPRREAASGIPAEWVIGSAAGVLLVMAMFLTRYNFGIRYLLPLLPLACIWCGGLLAPGAISVVRRIAVACGALLALESCLAAPWFLAFYNWPSGGVGGGDRLVNDSNVDWGQGLLALRGEMARRGIKRLLLSYHGTTDPAVYGIQSIPYMGGPVGHDAEWIAISSYYFVGLSQRMMLPTGRTEKAIEIDFRPLWNRRPDATPAGCMKLYRLQ